jgi:hypothetical protein
MDALTVLNSPPRTLRLCGELIFIFGYVAAGNYMAGSVFKRGGGRPGLATVGRAYSRVLTPPFCRLLGCVVASLSGGKPRLKKYGGLAATSLWSLLPVLREKVGMRVISDINGARRSKSPSPLPSPRGRGGKSRQEDPSVGPRHSRSFAFRREFPVLAKISPLYYDFPFTVCRERGTVPEMTDLPAFSWGFGVWSCC